MYIEKQDSSSATIVLSHQDSEDTRTEWNHSFEFLYSISLLDNGNQLKCDVKISNNNQEGGESFLAQVCLHTYFTIQSINDIQIFGLQNTNYLDKVKENIEESEEGEKLVIKNETDRIYKNVKSSVVLREKSSNLKIIRENMDDIVVWNPWIEKAVAMGDLPNEDYKSFVCIESGQIVEPFKLSPQQSVSCSQTIEAFKNTSCPKL